MPLLDHFNSPLAPRRHWESFHGQFASAIAGALNSGLLPLLPLSLDRDICLPLELEPPYAEACQRSRLG